MLVILKYVHVDADRLMWIVSVSVSTTEGCLWRLPKWSWPGQPNLGSYKSYPIEYVIYTAISLSV